MRTAALASATAANAVPTQWGTNGHWYEVIPSGNTWTGAFARAMGMSHMGHLVTFTPAAEETFVTTLPG